MDDTKNGGCAKPEKPYKEFPLFPHKSGYWCRKIKGDFKYFGRWSHGVSWKEALETYLLQKDDLYAGRIPKDQKKGVYTVGAMCNDYLTAKRRLVESGDIGPRRYSDCEKTCDRIVAAFSQKRAVSDLTPTDFGKFRTAMSKTLGMLSLSIEIQRVRGVFSFAADERLIDEKPNYGRQFAKPPKRALRAESQTKEKRMFHHPEVKAILNAAHLPLRTMALLGLNCGLGNHDIARLKISAVNLETGWIDFPRVKTAVERRCPLWKETIESLRDWYAVRPKGKPALVFVTRFGEAWVRKNTEGKQAWIDNVGRETRKLLDSLNIRREGVNFYSFRSVFETIGGDTGDQIATDFVMGHAPDSDDMASLYRKEMFSRRLLAVTQAVHRWVFGSEVLPGAPGEDS